MATLVRKTGTKNPGIITVSRIGDDICYAAINVNIKNISNDEYEWDALVLPEYALNNIYRAEPETKKSVLIAHIVKAYYNDNDVTAILNNYMYDKAMGVENTEHVDEFIEMQNVRQLAKDTVKEIMKKNLF